MENWPEMFSKQWDVCCRWAFKNGQKMYGSIQLESIIKADQQLAHRAIQTPAAREAEEADGSHEKDLPDGPEPPERARDRERAAQEASRLHQLERYEKLMATRMDYMKQVVHELLQHD